MRSRTTLNSPANSCNWKRLQHHPRRSVVAGNNSELLMMMSVMGGGAGRQASSLGSCPTWIVGSPMERSPPTPSPICSSPMSSLSSELCCGSEISNGDNLSFATANQSFCIMSTSNHGKMMATSTETAEEAAQREGVRTPGKPGMHHLVKNPIPVTRTRECEGQRCREEAGWRLTCERLVSFKTTRFEAERKLATVGEEEEEERERRRNLEHRSVSPLLSSDDYCSGGSNFGSEQESSDVDSVVEESRTRVTPASSRPLCTPASISRTKEAVDRLMAWKETRTIKLMNKLNKEEASIDDWERRKITDAEMEMKKLEAKLEKKRENGMEKMQRKIKFALKEAEKKKIKGRKAASRRITKVTTAFEKMVLREKTPWRLLFL